MSEKQYALPIELPQYFLLDFDFNLDSPTVTNDNGYAEIYIFGSDSKKHFRFTFEKLDAIKISRGEVLPYPVHEKKTRAWPFIYEIMNSQWLYERYLYEKKYYEGSYEFNGDVEEMKNDFKHLMFFFEQNIIEVICRGFWFEQSQIPFLRQQLNEDHPFSELAKEDTIRLQHAGLTGQIRQNPLPVNQLIDQAQYCSQKLYAFGVEINGKASMNHHVLLMRNHKGLFSSLRGHFGAEIKRFESVVALEHLEPYLKNHMEEVAERRRKKGL